MNGVDIANQQRASYETHLVSYRNWLPILYWFLDAAIVNAFCIQYIYMQQQEIKPLPTQFAFRKKLYMELFDFAALATQQINLSPVRLNCNRTVRPQSLFAAVADLTLCTHWSDN